MVPGGRGMSHRQEGGEAISNVSIRGDDRVR
jgi:hypothetical protein